MSDKFAPVIPEAFAKHARTGSASIAVRFEDRTQLWSIEISTIDGLSFVAPYASEDDLKTAYNAMMDTKTT